MDFTRKTKISNIPSIQISGTVIPYRPHAKFLGLTLDSKLNFSKHISDFKTTCVKRMNVLKYLNNSRFGLNEKKLLTIYRTMIRSKIDYGCQIYTSASNSTLKNLDTLHNACLRLCSGAFRTTPSLSIYCLT